jgi:hypothetical protein
VALTALRNHKESVERVSALPHQVHAATLTSTARNRHVHVDKDPGRIAYEAADGVVIQQHGGTPLCLRQLVLLRGTGHEHGALVQRHVFHRSEEARDAET